MLLSNVDWEHVTKSFPVRCRCVGTTFLFLVYASDGSYECHSVDSLGKFQMSNKSSHKAFIDHCCCCFKKISRVLVS